MKIAKPIYITIAMIFAILLAGVIDEPDDYVLKTLKITLYGLASAFFFVVAFRSKDIF